MATVEAIAEETGTLADLVQQLGDIPLERIRAKPAPGTATEKDLLDALEAPRKRICELVDGVLVEKPMGTREALLAALISHFLWAFLERKDLGVVIGADGALRLKLGLVRIPDVSFISWSRLPQGELPEEPIARVIPDLAVEVLSESNTKKEMERKLQDYFQAGVRIVWLVDPKTQAAEVYTSPKKVQRIGKGESLDGGKVLPGFVLPLKKLFARGKRKRKAP
jgi:Uma2 family endonuclease